ncbi:MAG: tetratricopeptide repeat protein [Syntrophomonadaceae bacterium]|jgi:tetratricopeptide (TPR) repeat protein|nr:tetratricopeptide repeat protein [Syntrophomonadaceae bacterium]
MENIAGRNIGMISSIKDLIKGHEISRALERLTDAAEVEDVRFFNHEAHCEFVIGDFHKAEALWKKTLNMDPGNVKAHMRLTEFYSPAFQAWLKRFTLSVEYIENKNYEQALVILKALLEEKEGIIAVYQLLGISYLACGDESNAFKVWRKGLEIDRANPLLMDYLGTFAEPVLTEEAEYEILEKSQDFSGSPDASYRKNHKKLVVAVCLLGFALLFQYKDSFTGKFSVVDSRLKTAPPAATENSNADLKAEAAAANENFQPSGAWTSSADTAAGDENEDGKSKFGNYPYEDRDTKEALEVMSAAVYRTVPAAVSVTEAARYDNISWAEKETLYYKGMQAYRNRKWDLAKENLQSVVALKSADYLNREALYYLARVNYLSGDYDAAEKYYNMYLYEFPDSNYYDDSLYFLGKIYYKNNQIDRARNAFLELKAIAPGSCYLKTQEVSSLMNWHE